MGAGDVGKSTIFKQLNRRYGSGYADRDRLQFKSHIHSQIVGQMQLTGEYLEDFKDDPEDFKDEE